MPRTFKATVVLIVTLIGLSLLTIVNLWQTNNAEKQVLELKKVVEQLEEQVASKLEGRGSGGTGAPTGREARAAADSKYQKALEDPDNLLSGTKKPCIPKVAADKMGGTLRRRLSTDPKGFNFVVENSADVQELQTYMHGQFAWRDLEDPSKFVPGLAYKITRSDDYKTYTIHLREGVYWHKPNVDYSNDQYDWLDKPHELTADDCVFSFNMLKNEQVKAGAAQSSFKDMKEAVKVDRYTCKVVWKKKTHKSLSATLAWYPMPKWLYTKSRTGDDIPKETLGLKFNSHWASRHPVGVGPYKFVNYEQGSKVVLERFDKYFGTAPAIERLEFNIVKKPQKGYLRLKSDNLDFAELSPPLYRKEIVNGGEESPFKNGKLEHRIIDEFAYYYLGWNMESDLFSQRKVRLAMTHALNRKGIIKNVLNGLGEMQTGPFYHKHEANSPEVEPYEFDLAKSRKLLEEAGWTDDNGDGVREKKIDGETVKFEFSMLVYNKPSARRYVSVYKNDLRKIGIILKPRPVNWPTMQKKMNDKDFTAYTGGWALAWGLDPYQIWHSSQAEVPRGSNRVGFKNKRADEIIMTLRKTFDHDKRIELLREFHEILHREQPYTFFYAPKGVFAWQPRVESVEFQKLRPQTLSTPWHINPNQRLDE